MATHLTPEALDHLSKNPQLQASICDFIGVKLSSMKITIQIDSRSLASYRSVLAIADDMGKKPDEIIHELPR